MLSGCSIVKYIKTHPDWITSESNIDRPKECRPVFIFDNRATNLKLTGSMWIDPISIKVYSW